jgi:argininosuccinate lyase
MVSYNESIYYDRAFHAQDILGSIAWARANHKAGILTASEFSAIESGLKKVEEEWVAGTFKIIPSVDEIFILRMSVGWERSLGRRLEESYTPAEAEMNKLLRTCDFG